jgi:hypothetical protein
LAWQLLRIDVGNHKTNGKPSPENHGSYDVSTVSPLPARERANNETKRSCSDGTTEAGDCEIALRNACKSSHSSLFKKGDGEWIINDTTM